MSLVLCNVGSAPRSTRNNSSDQNSGATAPPTTTTSRSSASHAVALPTSSSASALNRMHAIAMHQSPSSGTLHRTTIANDNNNNSNAKNNYIENDETNQVTIYRYERECHRYFIIIFHWKENKSNICRWIKEGKILFEKIICAVNIVWGLEQIYQMQPRTKKKSISFWNKSFFVSYHNSDRWKYVFWFRLMNL